MFRMKAMNQWKVESEILTGHRPYGHHARRIRHALVYTVGCYGLRHRQPSSLLHFVPPHHRHADALSPNPK